MSNTTDEYSRIEMLRILDWFEQNTSQNGHTPRADSYAWNHLGNAHRLLDACADKGMIAYVTGRQFPFYFWDGNRMKQDRDQYIGRCMQHVLEKAYQAVWQSKLPRKTQTDDAKFLLGSGNSSNVSGALLELGRMVSLNRDAFDTHDLYLPCQNGLTYDLATGEVILSHPAHLMTRCVPVAALTTRKEHPRFTAFVRMVMGDNREMEQYLLWVMSLFLSGYTGEKCFWFWQGGTDHGKTTILTFLQRLLGDDFVCTIPMRALLKKKYDGILHDVAETRAMRMYYAEEFKPGDELASDWIKRLSGEGWIKADRKGEANETFRSTGKLVIGTNDMPAITDVDAALRGRVRVLPFPVNVPAAVRAQGGALRSVAEVVDDLLAEADAILFDLVHVFNTWYKGGRPKQLPQIVADASRAYLDRQAVVSEWLEACCKHDANGQITTKRIEYPLGIWYHAFLNFSKRADTEALYRSFGDTLVGRGFDRRKAYDGARFTGPVLTDEAYSDALQAQTNAEGYEGMKRRAR
jgi:P4 family phage/plasmid primase-like protien